MKFIQGNIQAAFKVLVLLAILFIAFYVTIRPFSMVYDKLTLDPDMNEGLTDRSFSVLAKVRYFWLLAPFILAVGLILWMVTIATRKDPQYYRPF